MGKRIINVQYIQLDFLWMDLISHLMVLSDCKNDCKQMHWNEIYSDTFQYNNKLIFPVKTHRMNSSQGSLKR